MDDTPSSGSCAALLSFSCRKRASSSSDPIALARLGAVAAPVTLAGAQLALAREHGQPNWPALSAEVERRTRDWSQTVDAFLAASVGGRIGRAGRLLGEHPGLAGHNLATAIVLGNVARVEADLAADPRAATRRDPRSGWTALHAACSSRWHVDPARALGLRDVVARLLDAGADVNDVARDGQGWTPLRCAITSATAGTGNEPILRLLLECGATIADHDLYLAAFAAEPVRALALLLEHTLDVRAIAEQALAAPVSTDDDRVVRLLLEAGADPNRYRDDDGDRTAAIPAALSAGAGAALIELLLVHGADPEASGPDGRRPLRIATASGRRDVAAPLTHHGAQDTTTPVDRLLDACHLADRAAAERVLAAHPDAVEGLAAVASAALPKAAEAGNAEAVALMLDLGFPTDARSVSDDGATALHLAAYTGNPAMVALLLAHGAALEAPDTTWGSSPLGWAIVGSGQRPTETGDWPATVTALLDAGASANDIRVEPDDPKPPSPEVADLLRARGLTDES